MFSLEAEDIINRTWDCINRSINEKLDIAASLDEEGLSSERIDEAISYYTIVKNRKPTVYARALLLRANVFGVILELKKNTVGYDW